MVQLRWRLKRWRRIWRQLALAPVTDPSGFLQFVAVLVSLYLAFLVQGYSAVKIEAIQAWAAAQAFLYAVPIYLALCAVYAWVKTISEEREAGTWSGTKFVYAHPKLVFHEHVTAADNFRPFTFVIEDAEPGGSVEFRAETDGFERMLRLVTVPTSADRATLEAMLSQQQVTDEVYTLACVPQDKKFTLALAKNNNNPTIVRVFLLSWNTC